MTDADRAYVVLTAPLADDFVSVGTWTEVARVRTEPEAVSSLERCGRIRVLRADDLAALVDERSAEVRA